ncbi:dienelactone hydrolase family protein [Frankia sp. AgB1.9]|uniref:dienelactone hydrolase family protein n=1 Tax=unclassified Frankia TaxID=2632575 RepID=UPI001933223A|nr:MULTISPECIES: dienelactone hydrolase family protein [unclassified Frankia]MBL7492486.1 dienelactone hydrolase family protein [Frankia sp. AgW1.1]MBL7547086.1 dienelactone hydrolase family protein [Frankia sp. AgB1.9]MBL7619377.1 dienelactone hydrolase family protein [Frankia sp. AgB1.8]
MPAVTIPGGTTTPELGGYLATPSAGSGPWPGIVIAHDAFGLTDNARGHADRLAAAGYVTVVPNLYSAGGLRCVRATIRAAVAGTGAAHADLEAVRAYLAARDDCTGRIGVVGFCMGGGFALMAATRGFDASAPNYGMLPKGDLDELLAGACPVVASYGARDLGLRGAAAKIETALTTAGAPHDVKEYPKAGHSFMDRYPVLSGPVGKVIGMHHDGPAAEDAWRRILDFFGEHLR